MDKTGLTPFVLNKIEKLGPVGVKAVGGVRLVSRGIGPVMYGVSAYWNLRMMPKVMRDKTLTPISKATLVAGSAAMILSMWGGSSALIGLGSKIATSAGIAGLGANIGQAVLGKNTWLNLHLQGSKLA